MAENPLVHHRLPASSGEEAFVRLVRVILADQGVSVPADPEDALLTTLEYLHRERASKHRALEELRALRGSRAWEVVHALRRLRYLLVPRGSLRSRVARRLWSLGVGPLVRRLLSSPAAVP